MTWCSGPDYLTFTSEFGSVVIGSNSSPRGKISPNKPVCRFGLWPVIVSELGVDPVSCTEQQLLITNG